MTIQVQIKNLESSENLKEVLQVILVYSGMVRPVQSLHKELNSGEETIVYIHPGQQVLLKES